MSAVANRLSLALTGRITQRDYTDRTLAMATAYRALGGAHFRWVVFSYRQVDASDRERRKAERAVGHPLSGTAHCFAMFLAGPMTTLPKAPYQQQLLVRKWVTLLVDPGASEVLLQRSGEWAFKKVTWK